MNDRSPSDSIQPEWLAAYADDELPEPLRSRVEAWLRDHPEGLAELFDQQSLSGRNNDFCRGLDMPMPADREWDRVFSAVERGAPPGGSRNGPVYGTILVASSLAASLLLAIFLNYWPHRDQVIHHRGGLTQLRHDLIAPDDRDDDIYRVAGADDVELLVLPEAAAHLVVVGKHPMADVPLLLASAADVLVLDFGPDDQGNLPDLNTTTGPDASILWAPSVKP